jgi:hypothetical protein
VEFLNYKATLAELRPSGLVEIPEGDNEALLRFSLASNGKTVKATHRAAIGSEAALAHAGAVETATTIADPAESLPQLVEDLLHKHKVNEALVFPVGHWRAVCDLLAYELAADTSWQDIDAEASLHLNTRDPLLITPRDYHIIPLMLGALIRSAPDDASGEHDLTFVAAGVGMILEFRTSGAVVMTAANPSFCAEMAAMV